MAHGNKHIPLDDAGKLHAAAILAVAKVRYEKMRKASKESPCAEITELKIGQKQYAEACLSCIRTLADMLSNGVTVAELSECALRHGIPPNAAILATHDEPNVKKVNINAMLQFLKS